jgi:hypothetical protein
MKRDPYQRLWMKKETYDIGCGLIKETHTRGCG